MKRAFEALPGIRSQPKAKSLQGRYGTTASSTRLETDFKCFHCGFHVSVDPLLSGVNNRNHCPYCLCSKHLDWKAAGDRLSACKALMKPVGLTIKRTNKKYGRDGSGELMLIHVCTECGKVSINRIAADDDVQAVFETFTTSFDLDRRVKLQLENHGIRALQAADLNRVRAQLFGWN